MVICKYYLQGNCRFGENCKFQHQTSDSSGSILKQQNTNMGQSNVDTNTLVRSLTNDMVAAEKGGQWLLSCYAPFRDKPAFPGFEDQSFEEVRLGFYEAQCNGTIEQYKQQLQRALQEAAMRIKALQNPSADIVNVLKQIYNSPPLSSLHSNQGTALNFTTTQNQGSIFGGQAQTGSSVFGQSQQSVFGGSNQQNPFASQNVGQPSVSQTSVFGGKSPLIGAQMNQGTSFGGQNQSTVFGGQQPSIFSQQQGNFGAQTTNNTSIFAATPFTNTGQNAGNIFGQPQQQMQQNLGNAFEQPQQNIFGQQQTTNSFNPQQTTGNFSQPSQSIFSQQPQIASIFGQTQPNQSIFNQQQQTQNANFNSPVAPHTNSVFNQQKDSTGTFGQQQQTNIFAQPQNSTIFNQYQQPAALNIEQQRNSPLVQQNAPFNQQTSVFDQQNTTQSVFGQQPLQNSVFGQQPQSTFNNNQNIFGGNLNTGQNIDQNEGVYSKLEDLNENDMKCFKSDDFELGFIPEVPPTLEMCSQ